MCERGTAIQSMSDQGLTESKFDSSEPCWETLANWSGWCSARSLASRTVATLSAKSYRYETASQYQDEAYLSTFIGQTGPFYESDSTWGSSLMDQHKLTNNWRKIMYQGASDINPICQHIWHLTEGRLTLPNCRVFGKKSKRPSTPPPPLIFGKLYCYFFRITPEKSPLYKGPKSAI